MPALFDGSFDRLESLSIAPFLIFLCERWTVIEMAKKIMAMRYSKRFTGSSR